MTIAERRLVTALSGLAVLGASLIAVQAATVQAPEPRAVRLAVQTDRDGVTVQFVGDTMLADGAQEVLDRSGYDWPLASVTSLLDGDVVIANAEAPITALPLPDAETRPYSYNAMPPAAGALARAGVDVLGLANNHSMDRGQPGLADTIRAARTVGITTFGAGATLAEAETPLIIESPAGTVAVVGLGERYVGSTASDTTAGIPVLSRGQIHRSAALARAAGADWIVALVHWGENYQPVEAKQLAYATMFAEAGYDAVVGTGPHIAQRVEVMEGMPVLFSLGNFVFGAPGRFAQFGTDGFGIVAGLTFTRDDAPALDLRCIQTDNSRVRYRPVPCTTAQARRVLGPLHPSVTLDAHGVGRL